MEKMGGDLNEMVRTPLTAAHVAAMREAGRETAYEKGAIIAKPGDRMDKFVYVLEGEIEVADPVTGERARKHGLGPNQFIGEIAFLNGGTWHIAMRAAQHTRTIEIDRKDMLVLMSRIPEMSDIIISVFSARRRMNVESGLSGIRLLGEDASPAVRRIAEFLSRNRIAYVSMPLGSAAGDELAAKALLPANEPAVVVGDGQVIKNPTPAKLSDHLGLNLDLSEKSEIDVLIVGGGPAGVSAGVYAGAEGLSALVVEDVAVGGQAGTSSRIENYMGFPTGISGADLVWRGEVQAMKFGTCFAMPRRVVKLTKPDGDNIRSSFLATFDDGRQINASTVVVATGVQYRRLPLDRLEDFEGAGIYYAATEMEARYCKDQEVVIIGGGNSAGQAAMFLSRSASLVRILVRGTSLASSMSEYLSSRLQADPSITIEYGTEVTALHGDKTLEAVSIRSQEGQERRLQARALFIMVGAAPNTDWLSGIVDLDERGFVMTGDEAGGRSLFETSTPGIFAVGDVRRGSVKRVASSVGEGSVVISHVWNHLNGAA
ncbi:MAG: FAD-dependent oxidoreductase [Pseudomonadota bacterium]